MIIGIFFKTGDTNAKLLSRHELASLYEATYWYFTQPRPSTVFGYRKICCYNL